MCDEYEDEEEQLPREDVSARDCMLASEKSLAKIWSTPEEKEAWKYL